MTPRSRASQQGMVLLVSLSLLLALTLAAVSAAQTTVLELRMARNGADAALAFHAAETALLEAEEALAAGVVEDSLSPRGYREDAPWLTHGWPAGRTAIVVETVASIRDSASAEIAIFRITARGVGPGGAVAWLQTTYGVPVATSADPALTGRLSWVAVPWRW